MEIIVTMDRLSCMADEFTKIVESGEFSSAKLVFTETELNIVPLAEKRKIVLIRQA